MSDIQFSRVLGSLAGSLAHGGGNPEQEWGTEDAIEEGIDSKDLAADLDDEQTVGLTRNSGEVDGVEGARRSEGVTMPELTRAEA